MNTPAAIKVQLKNLIEDGDFTNPNSPLWTFAKATPESQAARETENAEHYFASSISGSATQSVSGIAASALYTLTVNTRGTERQSDGQVRKPTGYIEVKGGGFESRFYLEGVHDWKEQKMRFRSSSATDDLQIKLFGISGKVDFDKAWLQGEEEIIDPDELLKNGRFTQEEEYWRLVSSGPNAKAEIFYDNENPGLLTANLGAAYQSVEVALNKTYVYKFRAKVMGPTVGAPGGRLQIRNAGQGLTDHPVSVTNGWVNYEGEHVVSNTGGNNSLSYSVSGGALSSGTTAYFDDLSLKLKI